MGTEIMTAEKASAPSWEKLRSTSEDVRQAALIALWNANRVAMYNLSLHLLHDRVEAEDAVHEAFRRLLRALRRIEPQCSPRPYLMRIVNNVCVDFLRKKRPTQLPPISEQEIDSLAERTVPEQADLGATRRDWKETLHRAIALLPEIDRTVIVLKFVVGFTNTDAADIMRMPTNRFNVRLHRALKSLRESLNETDFR